MRPEHALRAVLNFKRYDGRAGRNGRPSRWDNAKGRFIPNVIIPMAPRAASCAVHDIMEARDLYERFEVVVRMVDPHDCWTFQNSLKVRNLAWNLKNFDRMQGKIDPVNGPTMFYWRGKYIIWNGNHRTTAALLLGRKIKARVYRKRKRRIKR